MSDPEIPEQPPQPGSSPGMRGKRNVGIFGGIGAGFVVLIVVLVVALSGGAKDEAKDQAKDGNVSGQSAGRSATLAWSIASLGAMIVGTWANGDDFIVATPDALTAYQVASGKQDWKWPVPSGETICRMSQSTSSPRGAVIYGKGSKCASLQVFDLTVGKPIWSAPVNLADSSGLGLGPAGSSVGLSIQGSYLVAPYGGQGVIDIDLATGQPVWKINKDTDSDTCGIERAVLVGTNVYYVTNGFCSDDDGSANPEVWNLWNRDVASATTATAMKLPNTCTDPDLLPAGKDLLVACTPPDADQALLLAPPGSSSLIKVKVTNPDFAEIAVDAQSTFGQFTLEDIPVDGDTLYLSDWTDSHEAAAVAAIDLDNGSTLWTAPANTTSMVRELPGATSAGVILGYLKDDVYAFKTMAASSGAPSAETTIDIKVQEAMNSYLLVGDYLIGIVDDPAPGGHLARNDQLAAYHLSPS